MVPLSPVGSQRISEVQPPSSRSLLRKHPWVGATVLMLAVALLIHYWADGYVASGVLFFSFTWGIGGMFVLRYLTKRFKQWWRDTS